VRILVIDNYDSFVYNLVQYLGQLGAACEVRRNDELSVAQAARTGARGILLSPGPGTPDRAGISIPLIQALGDSVPVLGVCLGHQAIAVAAGARVTRAPELLHGQTSPVDHAGAGVLAGLPSPFTATRYHSLAVVESTIPPELEVTARSDSRVVMAIRHRRLPVEGVQFHPESVLTEGGHLLLANWLARCGLPSALDRVPALAAQVDTRRRAAFALT
jgi:para-aminobenzoate synthetase component 2